MNQGIDTWVAGYGSLFIGKKQYSIQIFFQPHQSCQLLLKALILPIQIVQYCVLEETQSLAQASVASNQFWIREIFNCIFHWRQIKQYYLVVFELTNWNWEDFILRVHCFHCRNTRATFVSSIQIYNCLTSCDYSNLAEIKLLIPDWVLNVRFSECRDIILSNRIPTNCRIVLYVLVDELLWFGSNDEVFAGVPKYLNSTRVHASISFFCGDIYPWEQYNECRMSYRQFQDNVGDVL